MLGTPDLTDNICKYGGSREEILKTILEGRSSEMPAFKDILDESEIIMLNTYISGLAN